MQSKLTCPCCQKPLILSIDNDAISLSYDKTDTTSELEAKQILEELNIEFG